MCPIQLLPRGQRPPDQPDLPERPDEVNPLIEESVATL
jgi:hypothetical protein